MQTSSPPTVAGPIRSEPYTVHSRSIPVKRGRVLNSLPLSASVIRVYTGTHTLHGCLPEFHNKGLALSVQLSDIPVPLLNAVDSRWSVQHMVLSDHHIGLIGTSAILHPHLYLLIHMWFRYRCTSRRTPTRLVERLLDAYKGTFGYSRPNIYCAGQAVNHPSFNRHPIHTYINANHNNGLLKHDEVEIHSDPDYGREATPPDGGYGWVCVAACFTVNCFTWGTVSAYGIYLSHYLSENLFPEASTWDYALIGGFNFAVAMLIAPIVTILTRRFGIHRVMLAGSAFQITGFVSASFATRIWQLHISQGVLIGCGIGFPYIPSLPILSQWFLRRRSLANGISAAGSGVGGAAFSWGTDAIVQRFGISWALRITGIIAPAAILAAIALIRDRNHVIQPSQLGFDTKLLRRYGVVLLLSWAFISMLGYMVLLFSLSDFALSISLTRAQATDVIGLLNVGTAVGRPIIGITSDKWSRMDTAGVLTLLCGLSCFAFWLPATSFGLTVFFAILCGAIVGVFWMTIGPLCVEVAGVKDLQSLLSLSWAAVIIPATVSEGIALKLQRSSSPRQYLYTQIYAGMAYLIASGLMFQLRRVVKKRQAQSQSA